MNDGPVQQLRSPTGGRKPAVRPRDAASLILLRGAEATLEVLVGRRPLSARFMPGVYVFPGGAIDPPDRRPWMAETATGSLAPRLARAARAAMRETWEEVGVLIGRPAEAMPAADLCTSAKGGIEHAYRQHGLAAAMDLLTYVGRAITPSHSSRRFNTRFFLGGGECIFGEPMSSEELEDVRWHPIGTGDLEDGLRDVTRFMLARAIAMRSGTAAGEPPLFYWGKNARRIGICREAAHTP